ncbi:MAG: M23 family metallopeptidase [Candidatus Tectomicrobia bacterium]
MMRTRIILGLCVSLLILPGGDAALSAKLYKYQDADGTWHFSDTPPETSQSVKTEQLRIHHTPPKVLVRQRGARHQPIFYATNTYNGPVELEVSLQDIRNISTSRPLPARFTIPALSEMPTLALWPTRQRRAWSYKYSYRYVVGDPKAQHKPRKPYRPPFASGQAYRISQAFNGPYSHHISGNHYAVDIVMPEGAPVHAARAGIVMDITRDFFTAGTDMQEYGQRANIVRILHDDGTMAIYAHLKLESNRVSPGMFVSAGRVLAESGNTGFSTGPHLHFAIQKNTGMQIASVPFQFEGSHGQGIIPYEGMVLTAYE